MKFKAKLANKHSLAVEDNIMSKLTPKSHAIELNQSFLLIILEHKIKPNLITNPPLITFSSLPSSITQLENYN